MLFFSSLTFQCRTIKNQSKVAEDIDSIPERRAELLEDVPRARYSSMVDEIRAAPVHSSSLVRRCLSLPLVSLMIMMATRTPQLQCISYKGPEDIPHCDLVPEGRHMLTSRVDCTACELCCPGSKLNNHLLTCLLAYVFSSLENPPTLRRGRRPS